MKKIVSGFIGVFMLVIPALAAELHVAVSGKDDNPGTKESPFRTIQRAAELAQPGDTVTVHAGTYRERVNPPRGGESDDKRIVYQAASGEKVEIKGSEVVKGWVKAQGDTWKVTLPNSFFGGFNPYNDLIHGDWFDAKKRQHHTGEVYLNGEWLAEAAEQEEVLKPVGKMPLWFAQVDKDTTTIWAQFPGVDPNAQQVELNVRQTVFYPDKPGRNYITVRGFTMRNAATPWASCTAEQIGLIGTHWSKGWIIESNTISHSMCVGVTLGKYGDEWDNKARASAAGYVGTIKRALQNGWNKDTIGHHLVRDNTISHCEQAGINGSLGAAFSAVTGNVIHDIHMRHAFSGADMAGIKFHGAIDTQIAGNHIYRSNIGVWLDWMAQGARVSANCFHDNGVDLLLEVNHGPFLVDNNLFLSPGTQLSNWSQGGAFVHNLIAGRIYRHPHDHRATPFHKPHSTEIVGFKDVPSGDDRYYNNLLAVRADLSKYDEAILPVWMDGNIYLKGAKPSKREATPLLKEAFDPQIKLAEKSDGWYLDITIDQTWATERTRKLVTTELLGKATVPNAPYERPDGSPLRIDTDYFGKPRNDANPMPGPFEFTETGKHTLKVFESR